MPEAEIVELETLGMLCESGTEDPDTDNPITIIDPKDDDDLEW